MAGRKTQESMTRASGDDIMKQSDVIVIGSGSGMLIVTEPSFVRTTFRVSSVLSNLILRLSYRHSEILCRGD